MAKSNRKVESEISEEAVLDVVVEHKIAEVNCERLNVRKAPNLEGQVITVLESGTKVTLDDVQKNSDWLKVTLENGSRGWVMAEYVTVL